MRGKLLILTLICSIVWAKRAHAADLIEIDVHTSMHPTEAIGLVMTEHGTEQRTDAEISWKRINSDTITVTLPLGRSDRAPGTIISALVMDDAGEMAFGNNKPADAPELSSSIFSLPNCPGPKMTGSIESQGALLQSLLEVRVARRAKLQSQLNASLQGDLLARLNKLERGFGLNHGEPLSGNLPALELEDRLARLVQAITNYRARRPSSIAAANAGQ